MTALRLADGTLWSLAAPRILGILNVTPDSFSDGGQHAAPDAAVAHGLRLVREGADAIDVGGESTRPGAAPVPPAAQCARVVPVVRALARETRAILSVDTSSAEVAEAALAAGAHLVNDVTAGRGDPRLLPLVAARGAPVVLMHMRGTPRTMQQGEVRYDDVVAEVAGFLAERAAAARAAGVAADRIVLDPGLGFGKTAEHNLVLIRDLAAIAALGFPVLLGPSRKAFLGRITGRPVEQRDQATAGAVAAGILAGARIVRVHDVARMIDVVRVASAIRLGATGSRDGEGPLAPLPAARGPSPQGAARRGGDQTTDGPA